ncbi:DUF421 domain-containing protein [Kroppenstedtia eburnea]|uniref:Uncharacterized membrane protein YcaP, DUF421 family n=1 Tax=Kroppenstedtia eburnea TaxID=714067 RepID=A0A1N7KW87_9BACL|nr:YetF domain-containing protein [Kroppenstedtia eburnea]EGK12599.1 hypothetical protein HMPREF9374_1421 [Desmospora sp. 8437]QKI82778.1 DUF421 domain-containing protein [Kroppenstedtia eburnea]SIS65902.1 Uncharacterized membrane protein YcaP, DUF421 family [Kroppenstedtia eburnea]
MSFIWQAFAILAVGYILIRIAGKKAASEMTGLELITLLAMASMIGHAVSEQIWWKTALVLCIFVFLLVTVQFLSIKFDTLERLFLGKATVVIKNGKIQPENLKKLRMSVDQLEGRMRNMGIHSFADVKTGTIEANGEFGYELMRHAKPVTIGDLEKILKLPKKTSKKQQQENIFTEVLERGHQKEISSESD